MPETKLLNFKATEEEILLWDSVAHMTPHRNRSRWIRDTLNAACSLGGPVFPKPPPVAHSQARQIAKDLHAKAKGHSKSDSATKGTCDNRVPKGAYCKRCGQTHD